MATRGPGPATPGPDRVEPAGWGCWMVFLWFWVIVILFFAGWGWGGWYGRPWWQWRQLEPVVTAPGGQGTPAPAAQGTTVAGDFLGREVTLSGKINHVYGTQAFTLGAQDGGHDLLVVQKAAPATPLKDGEMVQVTGTVERFDRAAFRQKSAAKLDEATLSAYEGRAAIFASAVF
jgi:hypothetical protein